MQKQSIYSTYDFVSIFNVLKTCINTHLFFTRERIDMTERWMIRSFETLYQHKLPLIFFSVILQVSRMGNLLRFGFLLLERFSFHHFFFCFSLNSQKRSHSSICVFSNSYSIAPKFEVT